MKKIITIHGTFSNDPNNFKPLEGDAWWQIGSDFQISVEDHLRQNGAVEAGEKIDWEPIPWSSLNDEIGRRDAGNSVAERLAEIDREGTPYWIVSHSHGGSVVSHALWKLAKKKIPLDGLKKWITVGTPFVEFEQEKYLVQRLGSLGKFFYFAGITLFTLFFLLALDSVNFYDVVRQGIFDGDGIVQLIFLVVFLAALLVFALVFIAINFFIKVVMNVKYFGDRRRILVNLHNYFSFKFSGIWHENDEVINGLQLAHKDNEVLDQEFFKDFLGNASFFIIPLIITLLSIFADTGTTGSIDAASGNSDDVNSYLLKFFSGSLLAISEFAMEFNLLFQVIIIIAAVFALVLIIYFVFFMLFRLVAFVLAARMSRRFNITLGKALKKKAVGNKTHNEESISISPQPFWLDDNYPPLKGLVADKITERSDKAISKAVTKLRSRFGELVMVGGLTAQDELLKDLYTGPELIHTTYFEVEEFRQLIADEITKAS